MNILNEIKEVIKGNKELTIEDEITLYITNEDIRLSFFKKFKKSDQYHQSSYYGETHPIIFCLCKKHNKFIQPQELHTSKILLIFPSLMRDLEHPPECPKCFFKPEEEIPIEIIINIKNNQLILKSFSKSIPQFIIDNISEKISFYPLSFSYY